MKNNQKIIFIPNVDDDFKVIVTRPELQAGESIEIYNNMADAIIDYLNKCVPRFVVNKVKDKIKDNY